MSEHLCAMCVVLHVRAMKPLRAPLLVSSTGRRVSGLVDSSVFALKLRVMCVKYKYLDLQCPCLKVGLAPPTSLKLSLPAGECDRCLR